MVGGWGGGLALFPAFAPSSSKVAVRFLVSLYLLSRIGPQCTCIQLFLAPYSFFVFCCSRKGVPSAVITAPQQKVPGPSLSHSRESTLSGLKGKELKSESEVAQSCETLCDPMDGNLPGSVVHGIFQAILE